MRQKNGRSPALTKTSGTPEIDSRTIATRHCTTLDMVCQTAPPARGPWQSFPTTTGKETESRALSPTYPAGDGCLPGRLFEDQYPELPQLPDSMEAVHDVGPWGTCPIPGCARSITGSTCGCGGDGDGTGWGTGNTLSNTTPSEYIERRDAREPRDIETHEAQGDNINSQPRPCPRPHPEAMPARVLLAGIDTLYLSFDTQISEEMRARLDTEKQAAQSANRHNRAHCPDWLGARVLPSGAKGGYSILLETEDFTVKILGDGIPNRPGLYVELRSLFLHTHPEGPAGACMTAIAWIRDHMLSDQNAATVGRRISISTAQVSRVDIHIDWQGGYTPQLANLNDELSRFIRRSKTKGTCYVTGQILTGYTFGKGCVQARLYNKTLETKERANDDYAALLTARNGEAYDPAQDVWRLEFELRRDGVKGFRLYAAPEVDDDETKIEAELAAEELEHIGTLPQFFAHMAEVFAYLTQHWLRFVEDNGTANRSRWPLHPTWATLRSEFARLAQEQTQPLDEDQCTLVRGARYSGKARILRRMQLGVLSSLELEDASPISAALLALQRWVEKPAEQERTRIAAKHERYAAQNKPIPPSVMRGMDEGYRKVEQIQQRVQMLLGIFAAHEVLSLEFKPAHSVADLLMQCLDGLELEAERKGGIQQLQSDHFARVFKVRLNTSA